LYKDIQVIILDEATSGLDNMTEKKLLKDIFSLNNITFILISHNLDTLEDCDLIYELESKKLRLKSQKNN